MKRLIPIIRMFDEVKTKEFYLDFLGFKLDWEHRFEPGTPLYMQASSGDVVIHLSEHYGDAAPGSSVRVEVEDIRAYNRLLLDKKFKFARPGLETMPWKTIEMRIDDPSGNRVIFYESIGE